MPKLSLIIPTFNSGAVLSNALDSIISQSFSDWEVLIMDGVSSDDTLKIAQSYKDSRIRICSESDKGIYDAMNKGIKKATGEWLYFLGSDDSLSENTVLEKVFVELEKGMNQGVRVLYGDVFAPQLASGHQGEWTAEKVSFNRCHQAIFYHREVFEENGLYNTKYRIMADYAFNLKWFLQRKIKSRYVPIAVANYRTDGVSSREQDVAFDKNYGCLVLRYGWRRLPIHIQKETARDVIKNNPNKFALVFVMRVYVLLLRFIAKVTGRP